MAIVNRIGLKADFDPSKLRAGEFAYVLDTTELFYCYNPGNVKKLLTMGDIEEVLNVSVEAYNAFQQLIADLEDETVLTGILNDIVQLKSNVANKIDKTSIVQTDVVNDATKVPSSVVTNALGQEIDTINSKLEAAEGNFPTDSLVSTIKFNSARSYYTKVGKQVILNLAFVLPASTTMNETVIFNVSTLSSKIIPKGLAFNQLYNHLGELIGYVLVDSSGTSGAGAMKMRISVSTTSTVGYATICYSTLT